MGVPAARNGTERMSGTAGLTSAELAAIARRVLALACERGMGIVRA
jgi:hypothetical protein